MQNLCKNRAENGVFCKWEGGTRGIRTEITNFALFAKWRQNPDHVFEPPENPWCTPEKTRPLGSLSIRGIRTKNPLKKWSIGSGVPRGGPGDPPRGTPLDPYFGISRVQGWAYAYGPVMLLCMLCMLVYVCTCLCIR